MGGGYSCQTMNFVLLMLLDVNRMNAAAYPEPQIRGGGRLSRHKGGRVLPLDPPLEYVCHLMHGSVRCIAVVVVVCLSFVVVFVFFFPNLKQKVYHIF